MSGMTLFILFVAIIALLFLFINLVFAPHNPYQEKDSMFECGFHSFQQSRSPFNIAFFIIITIGFSLYGYITNNKEYKSLLDKNNSPIQLISQLKGYFYINP